MDDKTKQAIERLKNNQGMAKKLLQSEDGQQLMNLLTQNDNGDALQRATDSAKKGNVTELTKMIRQLMQSPEGASLIQRMNDAAKQ